MVKHACTWELAVPVKVERALNDAGNTVLRYTFRQSGLSDFLLCPERARLLWSGDAEDSDSAEAAIGTAVHLAVERFKGGTPPPEALEAARERFRGLSEAAGFKWVKVKTEETAFRHIETCFATWLRDIEPKTGNPWAIEQPFKLKFAHLETHRSDYDREIWLSGTIDYIDQSGLWDWKTCSRISKYTVDGWQLKRWAVQPTVYTWAAHKLGYWEDTPVPFTYAAMQRTPSAFALLPVQRGPEDWAWLERQLWAIAELHDANLSQWPMNDQHALCSSDWCPAWDLCKGRSPAEGELVLTS